MSGVSKGTVENHKVKGYAEDKGKGVANGQEYVLVGLVNIAGASN